MPRLRQVPKDEATAPIVTTMYEWLFEGRDPVAEPGRWDGTTGDWWTVFANSPDILDHCVKGFGLYQSPTRVLDPTLRELGQIRAGWAAGSQFVFSQHAKSMRELGMPEEQIAHIPAWSVAPEGTYGAAERAVLAYTDCLVYDHGRVPDELFAELQRHLDEVAILELTYITTLYFQHAVMSKALRTEFDDRDDPSSRFPALWVPPPCIRDQIGDGGPRRPARRRGPAHARRRGPVERVLLLRLRAGRRLHGRLAPPRPLSQPPSSPGGRPGSCGPTVPALLGRLPGAGPARRRPRLRDRPRRPADRGSRSTCAARSRCSAWRPVRPPTHRPARGRLHLGRADRHPGALDLDLTWTTDGIPYHYDLTTRYEIPCLVTGTVTVDGETFTVDGQGQRDHSWGVRDWWAFGWCWCSMRLDDGTRIHLADIRMIPGMPAFFGYVQTPGAVHPVTALTVIDDLGDTASHERSRRDRAPGPARHFWAST